LDGNLRSGVNEVRRTILFAGVPFVSAFIGTLLAIALALPTFVEAQESRMRADVWSLTGAGDQERVRLTTGPASAAGVFVLSSDGVIRAALQTAGGGTAGTPGANSPAAGFNLFAPDGKRIGRLGTATTPTGEYGGVHVLLTDRDGRNRLILSVDENGTPAITFLDAEGNVTWEQR
jgi:hypothetical protein